MSRLYPTHAGTQRVIDSFIQISILTPKDKDKTYGQSYIYKKYIDIFSDNEKKAVSRRILGGKFPARTGNSVEGQKVHGNPYPPISLKGNQYRVVEKFRVIEKYSRPLFIFIARFLRVSCVILFYVLYCF